MAVPGDRSPDQVGVIRGLVDGLAELKATVIGRWGRIPYQSSDPASPPNGSLWVRSDLPALRWRSGGITYSTPGPWTSYTPTYGNVTGGAGFAEYSQQSPNLVLVRGNISAGTATAAGTITVSFPFTARANSPAGLCVASLATTGITSFVFGGFGTITIYANSAGANWGLGASVAGAYFFASIAL